MFCVLFLVTSYFPHRLPIVSAIVEKLCFLSTTIFINVCHLYEWEEFWIYFLPLDCFFCWRQDPIILITSALCLEIWQSFHLFFLSKLWIIQSCFHLHGNINRKLSNSKVKNKKKSLADVLSWKWVESMFQFRNSWHLYNTIDIRLFQVVFYVYWNGHTFLLIF